jgi:hypothetical protein
MHLILRSLGAVARPAVESLVFSSKNEIEVSTWCLASISDWLEITWVPRDVRGWANQTTGRHTVDFV